MFYIYIYNIIPLYFILIYSKKIWWNIYGSIPKFDSNNNENVSNTIHIHSCDKVTNDKYNGDVINGNALMAHLIDVIFQYRTTYTEHINYTKEIEYKEQWKTDLEEKEKLQIINVLGIADKQSSTGKGVQFERSRRSPRKMSLGSENNTDDETIIMKDNNNEDNDNNTNDLYGVKITSSRRRRRKMSVESENNTDNETIEMEENNNENNTNNNNNDLYGTIQNTYNIDSEINEID